MNPCSVTVYPHPNTLFMRLFFCLFVVLTGSYSAEAGTDIANGHLLSPAPFVDLLHARHDGDFYDRQAREWEALAYGDCATDETWFHYYKTAHYSNRFGSGYYDLAAIFTAAEKACDPEGFEMLYMTHTNFRDGEIRWDKLLAAHEKSPDRHEAYLALATYYEVNGLLTEREAILEKLHQADPIPAGVMEYGYNQLMSVAPNGILITHGDTDTYPGWLLQSAYGVRPDVQIICLPLLLGFNDYRRELMGKELTWEDQDELLIQVINDFADRPEPLHIAATASYLKELRQKDLYLTGLAFRYSNTPVDNIGLLAQNYRSNWRLEQLRQPLADGPVQAVADQLNQNYIPALLELYTLQQKDPANHLEGLLPLLETIAERVGKTGELAQYLRADDPPQLASKEHGLRAKNIHKGAVYVPGGILYQGASKEKEQVSINGFWMQTTEVSNGSYQLFLEDLLRQRKFAMLDSAAVAKFKPEDIKTFFPEKIDLSKAGIHLTGSDPAFQEYPVVNVSRRAVELYAIWLAQVYNQDPKRIDGKNVRFRLPTAEEFEYAGRGGKLHAPYPWGGPYTRNSKGCYLANFNTLLPEHLTSNKYVDINGQVMESSESQEARKARLDARLAEEKPCGDGTEDGGLLTVHVDAYFPNDFGLYNMSGNAGEMIADEGKTMGGSWLHKDYYMQLSIIKEQTMPHPSTGFRLVMEYID